MLLEFLQDMGDTLRLPVTFVIIEFIGTFAFAISGVRLSSTKHFDIFGAWIVGMATAIGGGTIRDLMLGVNPFWMTNGSYFVCCALAVLAVGMFGKYIIHHNYTWFIFDTIGLAVFTVSGTAKTLALGWPWWTAVMMGTMTGAAGGVVRDILIGEVPLIFRKEIYASACIIGSLVYIIITSMFGNVVGRMGQIGGMETGATIIAGAVVIAVRLIAVKYQISLPHLHGEDDK